MSFSSTTMFTLPILCAFQAFYLESIPSTLYKTSILTNCYLILYGKHIGSLMILSSTQNLCALLYCVNMCMQQSCLYMYFGSVKVLFRTPSLQLDSKLQIEESYLQFKVSLFLFSCLRSCYLFQYSKTFDFSVY